MTIFYEGDDPEGFRKQIVSEFGFDPATSRARNWIDGNEFDGWNQACGWAFWCPDEHLDAIYYSDRFPMGN